MVLRLVIVVVMVFVACVRVLCVCVCVLCVRVCCVCVVSSQIPGRTISPKRTPSFKGEFQKEQSEKSFFLGGQTDGVLLGATMFFGFLPKRTPSFWENGPGRDCPKRTSSRWGE